MGKIELCVFNKKAKRVLVAGSRPDFLKIAPIVRGLRMHRDQRSASRP